MMGVIDRRYDGNLCTNAQLKKKFFAQKLVLSVSSAYESIHQSYDVYTVAHK